jgi:hypothetical protein
MAVKPHGGRLFRSLYMAATHEKQGQSFVLNSVIDLAPAVSALFFADLTDEDDNPSQACSRGS